MLTPKAMHVIRRNGRAHGIRVIKNDGARDARQLGLSGMRHRAGHDAAGLAEK